MRFTSILTIDAPVEVVWRLTTEVEGWPSLTPTMTRVERLDDGPIRVGSRARVKQPRQPEAVWTVTHLEQGHLFTWQTTRPGLTMTGSHRLEQTADGCRNTLTLDLDGFGATLFARLFGRQIRQAIDTENAGFRARSEQIRQTDAP